MGNRRGLWIVVCLLLAGGVFWGVGQAVGPSGGDTELQNALDAIQHVKSFRGSYVASGQHSERVWAVDCNRVIVDQQFHNSQPGNSQGGSQSDTDAAFEMKGEQLSVGEQRFTRESDGSWQSAGGGPVEHFTAKWYCGNIAQGIDRDLLPDIRTMLHHAMMEKGDKKTVNGVRCREWKFDSRTAISSRQGSICIGVDDHLPYEMTVADGHYSYSDYNRPVEIEAPEAVLQPASSTGGEN
jgi:hypothetical protein